MKKLALPLSALLLSCGAWAAGHAGAAGHTGHAGAAGHAASAPAAAPVTTAATTAATGTAPMAEAEVRKIDKANRKITLKHGEIRNLDMPPMTMVFQLAEPAQADPLKAGDKVRFSADKQGSNYIVTRIEKQ